MYRKLFSIRPPVWVLLGAMLVVSIFSALSRTTGIIPASTFLYIVQPGMAAILALIAYKFVGGVRDRVRNKSEKAVIVGSVVAVWFVIYFLSGLVLTYQHNALFTSVRGLLLNLLAFGLVAACVEYARHATMMLVGRRNVVWFGVIVTIVYALQQIGFAQVAYIGTVDGLVKMVVSDIAPSIVASLLLTYLAITGGLRSMLTYRLGVVATTILPPIIPKFDWYLIGVSSILLAVAIYIAIDRNRQDRREVKVVSRYRHARSAYNVMFLAVMVALVLFMTGFFTYKPAVIMSNSMVPVFSRGSMVIVQKTDPMDVKLGDIVQYNSSGKMITHRVVAIDAAADGSGSRVFTTKGDNNPSPDPLVAASQIIGIIRAQIPYIGYPTVWLNGLSL